MKLVLEELDKELPALAEEAQELSQQASPLPRFDAPEDKSESLFARIRAAIAAVFTGSDVSRNLEDFAQSVDIKANDQVTRSIRQAARRAGTSAAGAELIGAVDDRVIQNFVLQNTALIGSVSDTLRASIEGAVLRGFQAGARSRDIRREILQVGVRQEKRALLIARDQVSKLQGQVVKARQTAAGVTRYQWQTAGDERVRDEHEALNGEVFRWDRPPSVGHPGEDINCRCVAIPVLD